MANISLSSLRSSTETSRAYDDLRQYPLSIRGYLKNRAIFDRPYDNRKTDSFLQRFRSTKYPVSDRSFGSPNEDVCNIFINILNDKKVNQLIDDYIFERKWVYHPVRQFEKWHTIARNFYGDESLFWIIIVFNRVVDPFQGLKDFNMVRIPDSQFLQDMPYSVYFDYTAAQF